MTKEEVYDSQINPLMDQIIDICKKHAIAHVATFALDDDLLCTSFDIPEDAPHEFQEIARVLFPEQRGALMVTT